MMKSGNLCGRCWKWREVRHSCWQCVQPGRQLLAGGMTSKHHCGQLLLHTAPHCRCCGAVSELARTALIVHRDRMRHIGNCCGGATH